MVWAGVQVTFFKTFRGVGEELGESGYVTAGAIYQRTTWGVGEDKTVENWIFDLLSKGKENCRFLLELCIEDLKMAKFAKNLSHPLYFSKDFSFSISR